MQRRLFIKNTGIATGSMLLLPSFVKAEQTGNIAYSISQLSAKAPGEKLVHFWSKCVGAGRANEGLRANWLEHLKLVKDNCGFEYLRFHGLFHDDMCVYRVFKDAKTGAETEVYNWQYIDELFDRMLDIGVKPFVELGFLPADMASGGETQFWWKGNVSPPKDFNKWAELVGNFTRHCVDRYGIDEVRSWYFEVWNEPNLHAFWAGSQAQYFELYKVSAKAIKAVDSQLRVGGPATSSFRADKTQRIEAGDVGDQIKEDYQKAPFQGVWIVDFLKYCKAENLPVDFVSTHPYPQGRDVNSTPNDLRWLKQAVKNSAYPNAELQLTEWSSSASSRDKVHDQLSPAAFIIKTSIDCIGLTDSLSYWTFADVFEEKGAGNTIFHGGFGMVNFQGIVKPSYHAYRMLNRLGNEIIHKEEGLVVTRNATTKKITALAYNYPAEKTGAINTGDMSKSYSARDISLQINDLGPNTMFKIETLDNTHGNVMQEYIKAGSPQAPNRQQTARLKELALQTKRETLKAIKGTLSWNMRVEAWACVLISQV